MMISSWAPAKTMRPSRVVPHERERGVLVLAEPFVHVVEDHLVRLGEDVAGRCARRVPDEPGDQALDHQHDEPRVEPVTGDVADAQPAAALEPAGRRSSRPPPRSPAAMRTAISSPSTSQIARQDRRLDPSRQLHLPLEALLPRGDDRRHGVERARELADLVAGLLVPARGQAPIEARRGAHGVDLGDDAAEARHDATPDPRGEREAEEHRRGDDPEEDQHAVEAPEELRRRARHLCVDQVGARRVELSRERDLALDDLLQRAGIVGRRLPVERAGLGSTCARNSRERRSRSSTVARVLASSTSACSAVPSRTVASHCARKRARSAASPLVMYASSASCIDRTPLDSAGHGRDPLERELGRGAACATRPIPPAPTPARRSRRPTPNERESFRPIDRPRRIGGRVYMTAARPVRRVGWPPDSCTSSALTSRTARTTAPRTRDRTRSPLHTT